MPNILLLTPENHEKNKPTKILNSKLEKTKSFSAGFNFYFETFEYENFHEALEKIFKLENSFIVLGELTEFGESLEETNQTGPRRKNKGKPTIKDRDGNQIILDLDDHTLKGFNALSPEKAINDWLDEKNIHCDVTWQITSSQKLKTEEARIRLYFECQGNFPLQHRKAWSQSPEIEADGSVYTCSQPIYTAPPIIKGGFDPITHRTGFIQRKFRKIKFPRLKEEFIQKNSTIFRASDFDFEDHTIPKDVLEGKIYRRYFMPLAFHYANKLKNDREAIFAIISAKAQLVKSREFDPENVYEYIDHAIEKIETEISEEVSEKEVLTAEDLQDLSPATPLPDFPENLMENWPEPWPLIWENFKKVPRRLEEPLLIPTILSVNAFFLRARFVNFAGKNPNFFFLNLAPSTAAKDVNSKNVIRDLDRLFKNKKNKTLINQFSGILNTESNITADSTFLQAFSDEEELFWINTEATRIFQQIKSATNSSVAGLSDKLVEVVDGFEITGKIKAAGKVKNINDPNCQVLFYAQPETIEKYIDETMVDSGLFGRALINILPGLENEEFDDIFGGQSVEEIEIDERFYDFYSSQQFLPKNGIQKDKITLRPSEKGNELLNLWSKEYVSPKRRLSDSLNKVLGRMGIAGEQLYTVVLGICQLWDKHHEKDVRKSIDVSCLVPLLEYWADTKEYAITNYVETSIDPLAENVLEVVKEFLTGELKLQTSAQMKVLKEFNMVPISQVVRAIMNRKKLIQKLDTRGDNKNVIARINQIIDVFVKQGILSKENVKPSGRTLAVVGIAK